MAARFDGRNGSLQISKSDAFNTGTKDFSISCWVNTEHELDDVLGDVVSKFDPARRNGFELSIRNNVGVTNSQSNYRNVHFGIDAGHIDAEWKDCGRPGNNVYVFSLTVFDGNLYGSTCETGRGRVGTRLPVSRRRSMGGLRQSRSVQRRLFAGGL